MKTRVDTALDTALAICFAALITTMLLRLFTR